MKKRPWLLPAILLGLSFFIAVLWVKPIGVSTQFSVAAGIAQRVVDRDIIYEDQNNKSGYASTNAYLNKSEGKLAKAVVHPLNYGMVFVLSIPLGVWIATLVDKKRRQRSKLEMSPAEQTVRSLNEPENKGAYGLSLVAGFLLIYGARMAGGCTSGHMMSGMMQSSVSGFLFAAVVFAVAIPLAFLRARHAGNREKK